jgi:hypothetical protein
MRWGLALAVVGFSAAAWAAAADLDQLEALQDAAATGQTLEELRQAEQEHALIVEHLTGRLGEVVGGQNVASSAEERAAFAKAMEPVFLQLEHAVKAHTQTMHKIKSRSLARSGSTATASVGGFGQSSNDETCFACLYLMQRVLAFTEPFFSPAVRGPSNAAFANEAFHPRSGSSLLPVQFPMSSAYQTRHYELNGQAPVHSHLMGKLATGNGWATPTNPLENPPSAPVVNPWDQMTPRHRDGGPSEEYDAFAKAAEDREGEAGKAENWPRLDASNSPADEEKGRRVAQQLMEQGEETSSGEEEEEADGSEEESSVGGSEEQDEGGEVDESGGESGEEDPSQGEEEGDTSQQEEEEEGDTSQQGEEEEGDTSQQGEEEETSAGEEVTEEEQGGGESFLQVSHGSSHALRETPVRKDAPPWSYKAPLEAYEQWNEPKAIGPRLLPPIPPFMGEGRRWDQSAPRDADQGVGSVYELFHPESGRLACRTSPPVGVLLPNVPETEAVPCMRHRSERLSMLESALVKGWSPDKAPEGSVPLQKDQESASEPATAGPVMGTDSLYPLFLQTRARPGAVEPAVLGSATDEPPPELFKLWRSNPPVQPAMVPEPMPGTPAEAGGLGGSPMQWRTPPGTSPAADGRLSDAVMDPVLEGVSWVEAQAQLSADPMVVFLQEHSRQRARARAGEDTRTELDKLLHPKKAVNWGDVPDTAYLAYTEPPAIGPRVPPPVDAGKLPAKPLSFNKHLGAPLMSLPPSDEVGMPMIAPHAWAEAYKAGLVKPAPLDQAIPEGLSTPMLVPEGDGSDPSKVQVADVHDNMQFPFTLLMQTRATKVTSLGSLLQAGAVSKLRQDLSMQYFGDVPQGVYEQYAHPPAIGPAIPPPLPQSPGRPSRPVWGDAVPDVASEDSPASAAFGDTPLAQYRDGLLNPSSVQVAFPQEHPDVYSPEKPPLEFMSGGSFDAAVKTPMAALIQTKARIDPSRISPQALGMIPSASKSSGEAMENSAPGHPGGSITMPSFPVADVEAPDLDLPKPSIPSMFGPVEFDGKTVKPLAGEDAKKWSLLQARGDGPDFAPFGNQKMDARDMVIGILTPAEKSEKSEVASTDLEAMRRQDAELEQTFETAIAREQGELGAYPGNPGPGIPHEGGLEGMNGPSSNCEADKVDARGIRTGSGGCVPSGGMERVGDLAGQKQVFDKFMPSRGMGNYQWPSDDPAGLPVMPIDARPGGPPVKAKDMASALSGKLMSMFGSHKKPGASPSPSPIATGVRGPSTGGGDAGPRFAPWWNPEAGLFDEPECTTEKFNEPPVINRLDGSIHSNTDCYSTSWIARNMDDSKDKNKVYGKPNYGKTPRSVTEYNKFRLGPDAAKTTSLLEQEAHPLPRPEHPTSFLQTGSVSAEHGHLMDNAHGKAATRRLAQSARAAVKATPHQPAAHIAAVKATPHQPAAHIAAVKATPHQPAALKAAPRLAERRASAEAKFPGGLTGLGERLKPLPYLCRDSAGGLMGICRQRLRGPSPWAMRRDVRRNMMQSRISMLEAKWRDALERMCTSQPALGQARPPVQEAGDSATGKSPLSSLFGGKLGGYASKLGGYASKLGGMGAGSAAFNAKPNQQGPKGGLDDMLRKADQIHESGYEGPRPPPRLQSEGLNSAGKVEPQPFTGWVTEPTQFGDHPSVGQMADFGVPPRLAAHCKVLSDKLGTIAQLYLHAYDLEEACSEVSMCKPRLFGLPPAS